MNSEQKFISASAVSRRLDVPVYRVIAAIKSGALVPDAELTNLHLFDVSRLDQIGTILGRKSI